MDKKLVSCFLNVMRRVIIHSIILSVLSHGILEAAKADAYPRSGDLLLSDSVLWKSWCQLPQIERYDRIQAVARVRGEFQERLKETEKALLTLLESYHLQTAGRISALHMAKTAISMICGIQSVRNILTVLDVRKKGLMKMRPLFDCHLLSGGAPLQVLYLEDKIREVESESGNILDSAELYALFLKLMPHDAVQLEELISIYPSKEFQAFLTQRECYGQNCSLGCPVAAEFRKISLLEANSISDKLESELSDWLPEVLSDSTRKKLMSVELPKAVMLQTTLRLEISFSHSLEKILNSITCER